MLRIISNFILESHGQACITWLSLEFCPSFIVIVQCLFRCHVLFLGNIFHSLFVLPTNCNDILNDLQMVETSLTAFRKATRSFSNLWLFICCEKGISNFFHYTTFFPLKRPSLFIQVDLFFLLSNQLFNFTGPLLFQIMRDPDTGNSRGFGFVSYDSFEASDAAIEVCIARCSLI